MVESRILVGVESKKDCGCRLCGRTIPAGEGHVVVDLGAYRPHFCSECHESGTGTARADRENISGSANRCVPHTLEVVIVSELDYDYSLEALARFADAERVNNSIVKMEVVNKHGSTKLVKWAFEREAMVFVTDHRGDRIELDSVEAYKAYTDKLRGAR